MSLVWCAHYTPANDITMDRREELFWRNVSRKNKAGCMNWRGVPDEKGYGRVGYNGLRTTAHRIAYMLKVGEITDGMVVMHKCDNRLCCNPEHLEVGTQAENLADMRRKGRANDCPPTGERHGRCKIPTSKVDEIRSRYAKGGITQCALAEMFGISQTQIGRIVRMENRKSG